MGIRTGIMGALLTGGVLVAGCDTVANPSPYPRELDSRYSYAPATPNYTWLGETWHRDAEMGRDEPWGHAWQNERQFVDQPFQRNYLYHDLQSSSQTPAPAERTRPLPAPPNVERGAGRWWPEGLGSER